MVYIGLQLLALLFLNKAMSCQEFISRLNESNDLLTSCLTMLWACTSAGCLRADTAAAIRGAAWNRAQEHGQVLLEGSAHPSPVLFT